jgi:hypothetical protein
MRKVVRTPSYSYPSFFPLHSIQITTLDPDLPIMERQPELFFKLHDFTSLKLLKLPFAFSYAEVIAEHRLLCMGVSSAIKI